jgi:GTP pyrophosphokinase
MDDDGDPSMKHLRFTIQVEDRVHLARTMRGIRSIDSVARILRERS